MDDRPSVWAIGLGLGLCAVAALLLGAIAAGAAFELSWLAIGASVIVIGWFGLPAIVWAIGAGWAAFWAWRERRDAWQRRNDRPPAPVPAAPPAVVLRYATGLVNGRPREPLEIAAEPRTARWTAWQLAAERWLGWYKLLRTCTSGAMVGPHRAFDKPASWVAFTDELDRVGVVDKMNGKRTVLRASLDATEARILSGEVEWSEEMDAPGIRPPALLPTSVPVTVEGTLA